MNKQLPVLPAVAVLALVCVVSSTTGAVAGSLVTSADIKDGTIKLADLDHKTVKRLQGEAGPAGAPGAAGANGSALAYGYVNSDTTVDPASTKGLVSVVSAYGSPTYACLNYTGGTPKVVVVSPGYLYSGYTMFADTDPDTVSTFCGANRGADILVVADDSHGNQTVPGFDIAVIA